MGTLYSSVVSMTFLVLQRTILQRTKSQRSASYRRSIAEAHHLPRQINLGHTQ